MYRPFLASYDNNDFAGIVALCVICAIALFFISLFIFRSIFNIPSFLRYQRAQMKLLEEIAKQQGVDGTKVQSIVSETIGWEGIVDPFEPTAAPQ
jgi:hypothetical protein